MQVNIMIEIGKAGSFICVAKISDFETRELVFLLGDDEKQRLERFRRPADRQRYALAHGLKRFVISHYVACASRELQFDQSSHGKPFCVTPNSPYFNLSHSGEWVALAVSTSSDVGIDIEFERTFDTDGIVQRVCSKSEVELYRNSDSPPKCFLCLWTQKEAVSKACGRGISVGLQSIPCSGKIGQQAVTFLDVDYTSYTCSFPDDGVLTYVAGDHSCPAVLRAIGLDGNIVDKGFEIRLFAL
jgi:phosphopantetheinyl transferase